MRLHCEACYSERTALHTLCQGDGLIARRLARGIDVPVSPDRLALANHPVHS